jgi:DNA-binding transcriptional ArsR family regulator
LSTPSPASNQRVGAVFAALADPTRRHLVESLAAQPNATATGLAADLPISRQAVAKHLATLGDAGLLNPRRNGRETNFELRPQPLAEAMEWMAAVGTEWDKRLDKLNHLLNL